MNKTLFVLLAIVFISVAVFAETESSDAEFDLLATSVLEEILSEAAQQQAASRCPPPPRCRAPNCNSNQYYVAPKPNANGCITSCGKCVAQQKRCPPKPMCKAPGCNKNQVYVAPKPNANGCETSCGSCQPKPTRCPMFKCALPKCASDEELFTPKSETGCNLCPKCRVRKQEFTCLMPPCAMQRDCKRTEQTFMMQNGVKCPGCPRCVEFENPAPNA